MHLSIYRFIYLPNYLFIYLSIHIFICLFINQFIYLYIHLCIYLCIHLSTFINDKNKIFIKIATVPILFPFPFHSFLITLYIISRYPLPGKPPKSKSELDTQDASILHWQFLFHAFQQICDKKNKKNPKRIFIFQQSCGSGGMWLWLKV